MAKDGYVPMHITNFLSEIGYTVTYQILSADDFGVPQRRPRAFFVAIQKELEQLKEVTLKYTKITPEEYKEHIKDDWWMTADEALKYGVCDEIAKEFV